MGRAGATRNNGGQSWASYGRFASHLGPAVQPLQMTQRARVFDAMVSIASDRGFAGTTVTAVCARARVSRGTFYELFDDLEDCLLAVIDEGYLRAHTLIAQAFERERSWREGVREALVSLLALFDEEPRLARVWFVETLAAGSWALERRERHVAALTAMIVERWPLPRHTQLNPLAAPAVMQAILGLIHTHLLTRPEEPLVGMLAPLMGLITALYLRPRSAAAEIQCAEALSRSLLAERRPQARSGDSSSVQIPGLLRDPRAHRARSCLLYLAEHPGASNRQIASAVSIARHDQISTLLARLARIGLLVKREGPPGHANAWSLSPHGLQVAHVVRQWHEKEKHPGSIAAKPASPA